MVGIYAVYCRQGLQCVLKRQHGVGGCEVGWVILVCHLFCSTHDAPVGCVCVYARVVWVFGWEFVPVKGILPLSFLPFSLSPSFLPPSLLLSFLPLLSPLSSSSLPPFPTLSLLSFPPIYPLLSPSLSLSLSLPCDHRSTLWNSNWLKRRNC